MATLTIHESLHLNYADEKELLNMLLEIHGFTKKEFAEIMKISLDTVKSWVRDDVNVPIYALRYLIDTLELELKLIGYALKVKKMTSLTKKIRDSQENIINLRLENSEIPQTPLHFEIGNLVTDDVFVNLDILSNSKNILTDFYREHKS